jgi:hypothetical protein
VLHTPLLSPSSSWAGTVGPFDTKVPRDWVSLSHSYHQHMGVLLIGIFLQMHTNKCIVYLKILTISFDAYISKTNMYFWSSR